MSILQSPSYGSISADDEDDAISFDDSATPEAKLLNKASWFSCYINLTSTIIGAGVLGLPYSFSKTGWIGGLLLVTLCAVASTFALHLLSLCIKKTKTPSSFYQVAEKALPRFSWLIDLSVAVKCFGVAISYLIVIGDLMPAAMVELNVPTKWQKRNTWIIIGFCCAAPLSCFSSLDALKWSSAISLLFVLFLTVVIVMYAFPASTGLDSCFGQISDCKGSQSYNNFSMESMKVISVFIFGYSCQQNIFGIVNELFVPSQPRVNSVIGASVGSAWIVYVIVASFGYITYGDKVMSDVLKTYPGVGGSPVKTPVVTACRISMSLIVACHYPLQAHPARRCVLSLIQHCAGAGAEPNMQTYNIRYIAVTVLFLLASFYIALSIEDLGQVLAMVGATGSTVVCYILPGIFYVRLHRREGPRWKRAAALALFLAGLVIMPLCLVSIFL